MSEGGVKEKFKISLHNPVRTSKKYIFSDIDSAEEFYFNILQKFQKLNLIPGKKNSGINIDNDEILTKLVKKLNSSNVPFLELENVIEELKKYEIYYTGFQFDYYSVIRFFANKNTKLNRKIRFIDLILEVNIKREKVF